VLNLLCREQKRQSFRALLGAQAQSSPELVSRRQVLGSVEVAQTSASPDSPDHLVCLSAFAGVLCGQSARQVPGPLNYQAVLSFLPNETVERRLGRTQFPNGKATSATRVYRAFLPESQRKERWKVYDS